MENIAFSKLAEFNLKTLDLNLEEEEIVFSFLKEKCTFKHSEAFEYIIHLYQDDSEAWFVKNELSSKIPQRMIDVILEARNHGAARICFYY